MSTLRFKSFNNPQAFECNKLLDYYHGNQLPYVKKVLDQNRVEWKSRNKIARFRNITKPIIDKSSSAFNDPPTLITENSADVEIPNEILRSILENSDYVTFWQNVAHAVRGLKTVVIYYQKYLPVGSVTENQIYKFNPFNGDSLMMMMTHHGNSEVIMDPSGRFIIEFAYKVELDEDYLDDDESADDVEQYMVVTPTDIETWIYKDDQDFLVDSVPNPEGFVTAQLVHDCQAPIYGAWNAPGSDLVQYNEMYNVALTDTEHAIGWAKNKTLFTNGDLVAPDSVSNIRIPSVPLGHTDPGAMYDDLPQLQGSTGAPNIGGLGSIVKVNTNDIGVTPFIKFDGPQSDLESLNQLIDSIIENLANDWSVNVRLAGHGSANSGFQLIVEAMDELNLRTQQVQFFQKAFRIMYQILQRMYPELPTGNLMVQFQAPRLPVNEKERDAEWVSKLSTGRASIVDYLMVSEDLTLDEAVERAAEIKKYNDLFLPKAVDGINKDNATSGQFDTSVGNDAKLE